MRINVVNTAGRGTIEPVNMEPGSTVSDYFRQYMGGQDQDNYKFILNGRPATPDEPMHEGDTLTISKSKLAGAA